MKSDLKHFNIILYHKSLDYVPYFLEMTLTGLALAKTVAIGIGLATATGAAAVATGNVHGLAIAFQHIPSWSFAHNVLSRMMKP